MYAALKKFLILHHHLTLPGIGNFYVEETPASLDFTNRSITAPASTIIFNDEKLPADKQFFHFLAQELNVDEVQGIRHFTDFTTQLQNDINNGKSIALKGFGNLSKQSNRVIHFEEEPMPSYMPALTAERIIRKNATHTVLVGEDEKTSDEMQVTLNEEEDVAEVDRWWIPAVVLGLIGIAALIYYYNVLHHSFFK